MSRPVVYLAGPFTAANDHYILQNVKNAIEYGEMVIKIGGWPVIPHLTWSFEKLAHRKYPDRMYYDWDLAIMARCDAVLVFAENSSDGDPSKGVANEKARATDWKIPTFTTLSELETWIQDWQASV